MNATDYVREQQLKAVTAVMRAGLDPAEQRAVLESLFARPRIVVPRGMRGRKGRPAGTRKPCGTPAAYQYHRRHGEPVDEPCRAANAVAEAERKARRVARAKAADEEG